MKLINYRIYLTPDEWQITYNDEDFVRVRRNTHLKDGYIFLFVETIYGLLSGKRSAVKDKWSLYEKGYNESAHELLNQARINRVIELEANIHGEWIYSLSPKAEEAKRLYAEFCERRNERDANH